MRLIFSFLTFIILSSQQIYTEIPETLDLKIFETCASVKKERQPTANDIPEDSSSITNLEGEPSAIINNCVNAITGDFLDFQVDMVVPGAQPIAFQRTYSSSMNSSWGGWVHNHFAKVDATDIRAKHGVHYLSIESHEGSGVVLRYKGANYVGKEAKLVSLQGLSNCCGREISGRTNRKNTHFKLDKDMVWHSGAGNRRYFTRYKDTPFRMHFGLLRERLPNRNQFSYKEVEKDLRYIIARNSASKSLAYIKQSGTVEKSPLIMTSSDGRKSIYRFTKYHDRYYLYSAVHSFAPTQMYNYTPSTIIKIIGFYLKKKWRINVKH